MLVHYDIAQRCFPVLLALVCFVCDGSNSDTRRVSNDLSSGAVRSEAIPFGRTAQALLNQRHNAMEARLKDFRAPLQTDETKDRGTIDA